MQTDKPITVPANSRKPQQQWLASWQFWTILTMVFSGGIGFVATTLLLRPSGLPNCSLTFWPTASASIRLYCAQEAANERTVEDILKAISLVRPLAADHPLRPEINRHLDEWAQTLLDLAEESFQAGQLSEAIATARQIPKGASSYAQVKERIQQWRSTWSEAEQTYARVEAALERENWRQAFREATHLLSTGNTYWETTKYEELSDKIFLTRQDINALSKARRLAQADDLPSFVEALKLAKSIQQESYLYEEARSEIARFGREMFALAQAKLEERDYQRALTIARQIPDQADLETEVQDFIDLAWPQSLAWQGTISGLRNAITQAKKIQPERGAIYRQARRLVNRWEAEIEAIAQLERAREIALPGTVAALRKAIGSTAVISTENPRWDEVQAEIDRWRWEIESIEDRPYLDRADQLARAGTVKALKAAIDTASQIGPGRALSSEAQEKITTWTGKIQRIEDQPYLTEAEQYALSGDLPAAIAVAGQIAPGRTLYPEAQEAIQSWQTDIEAEQSLKEATRLVSPPTTPKSLAAAIRTADQVSESSRVRPDADAWIWRWSRQLLEAARRRARSDLPAAMQMTEQVPASSGLYAEAQRQIQIWQEQWDQEQSQDFKYLEVQDRQNQPVAPAAESQDRSTRPSANPEFE